VVISTAGLPETRPAGAVGGPLDEDWIRSRVAEGLTVDQIADRVPGLTPSVVRRELARYAIPEPNGNTRRVDPVRAQELDTEIRRTAVLIRRAWVHLASRLHELREAEHFRALGHDSFASYL
jgi:hypothetical protein